MCGQIAVEKPVITNAIDALIKRVNRKLARATDGARNLKLRKATPSQVAKLGSFYMFNTDTREVVSTGVSLSQYAQMFNVQTDGVNFEGGYCGIPERAFNAN